MKTITIELPDNIMHRLEVCAAKDGNRVSEGVARLLTYLVEHFEEVKSVQP